MIKIHWKQKQPKLIEMLEGDDGGNGNVIKIITAERVLLKVFNNLWNIIVLLFAYYFILWSINLWFNYHVYALILGEKARIRRTDTVSKFCDVQVPLVDQLSKGIRSYYMSFDSKSYVDKFLSSKSYHF